jgi:RNA polymerase sigma-70 factor (ECF subfamily)
MGPASPVPRVGEPVESEPRSTTDAEASWLRDPDVQLMLRVKNGDEAAFAELVAAYQDRLIGIFTHMLRNQEAAEDLAQEAFLRIYRARDNYRPTAKFSTWLFHIANNLASNARRTLGRRKEVALDPQASAGSDSDATGRAITEKSGLMPARQLARSEMRVIVQSALEQLSDRQRMAVLLHKFEGMSYADIAETMEMTPQAVKSLLSRARENLRMKLEMYIK